MKKLWFGIYCLLAVVALIYLGLSGQSKFIPGTALTFLGVSIGFFTKKQNNQDAVPTYFTLFLTAVSTAMVSLFMYVVDNFFVHYAWFKYLILAFSVTSVALYIISYHFMRKEIPDNKLE